jgi:hypothetical protein
MPLILFTAVDNNGLTTLVAGCLVSNERYESYCWALQQFRNSTRVNPVVVFSDGDTELARAIVAIWPGSVHLLCRFHIAQNINRALASILRADLSGFLDDFWRVGSIEDVEEYNKEFGQMEERWEQARPYLNLLKLKQEKWAFAYTHRHFVAGISSTQRQEMVNYQVKCSLLSNSTLSRIIDGFERVEKSTATKIIRASINDKMMTATPDPMIEEALNFLTAYAGTLLRVESNLSLSYQCQAFPDSDHHFRANHKDFPSKVRIVKVNPDVLEETSCSCRKALWHGIVCRHILCVFRHTNRLRCPASMFNQRWNREFASTNRQATGINYCLSRSIENATATEDDRASELSVISKTLILRSIYRLTTFEMVKSTLESLLVLYPERKIFFKLPQTKTTSLFATLYA